MSIARSTAVVASASAAVVVAACCWSPAPGPELVVRERFDPETTTQRERDEMVLRHLRAAGADTSRETEIIHYLYFPTEASARAAAREIGTGFALEVGARETEWAVIARHHQVPTLENLEAAEQVLIPAAERNGGAYDGWEAAITR